MTTRTARALVITLPGTNIRQTLKRRPRSSIRHAQAQNGKRPDGQGYLPSQPA
jgi:hypothetical protein